MRRVGKILPLLASFGLLVCCAGIKSERGLASADRASGSTATWQLLWSDEFDRPGAPNPEFWSHEVNCWGGGNNEQQCYTARLDNSFVGQDGYLHIVAKEEPFLGPSLQDDDPAYPGPDVARNYTSARLRTKEKVDWRYGRVEVRARLTGGKGMWPAVWMLPTDWHYGGWPSSGEIDIVESVNLSRPGFDGADNVIHGTLHYGLPWPQWENHGKSRPMIANPADRFHIYAIEWDADQIRWYVDGEHYQTQSSEGWYNYIWAGQDQGFVVANERAPFDQRFHLLLNLAVGGNWPGSPDRDWEADRELLIDYVRVYQCAREQAASGPGCRTVDPAVEIHRDLGAPATRDYVAYDGGLRTLRFSIGAEVVENRLVPGSSAPRGMKVHSDPDPGGSWTVEFVDQRVGANDSEHASVYIESAAMDDVATAASGFMFVGGSGWTTNGEIEFDLLVQSIDPQARLFVTMNSGRASRGMEIQIPPKDEWRHVAVRLSDLLAQRDQGRPAINLNDVQQLFVLQSTGAARLQVDRIRVQCAYNSEPESWQIDKTCDLRPRTPAS